MSAYKITLVGLYQYNPALFDTLIIPAVSPVTPDPGHPAIVYFPDKETLVATILEKASEFPALYSDYDFMRFMIGVWSKNCAPMMQKLWDTINFQYNPIHNYDRKGKIVRNSSSSGGGISTEAATAFNTDTFKDQRKTTDQSSATAGESVEETVSGNIGVMSTQQMLEQERSVAMFKWYDVVSDDFINKFCVQIY